MVEEEKENPLIALRPRQSQTLGKIEMPVWEDYFTNILNQQRIVEAHETTRQYEDIRRITAEEIRNTISTLKNQKATGPDGIFDEHIKVAPEVLIPSITDMMNLCLHTGRIPERWRTSIVRMLYKGKREPHDPN
ncbi:uncharacterized protein LOC126203998 [Schistocerca nitens]|uniref:uncharacterized protein LOC126203998 n=1 Tax=Schistocerca nitens TaxID=7011 RepID=UPI0021189824|nr:uncharacterized protein LOC126203998 [Schistocerca nitens]